MLRSVSAFEAYRDIYRDGVDERRVAELLILDPSLPRSLRFCFDEIVRILGLLPDATAKPARRLAATMQANLEFADLEEIYSRDYRTFLEVFLVQTAKLGDRFIRPIGTEVGGTVKLSVYHATTYRYAEP